MAQFEPGNQAAVGHGRPPKARELQVLDEIKANFPAPKVAEMLQEAYDIAKRTNSSRGILAVTQTVLDYCVGRPKPMEEDTSDMGAFILSLLQPKPPATIEAEAEEI